MGRHIQAFRHSITLWVKKFYPNPLRFSEFFPYCWELLSKILHAYCVLIYGKLKNCIQLSLTLTKIRHIKHNHLVNFHFTNFVAKKWLHCKGWMATKVTRPQPTWLSCVGCNASGISQTSPKAQDHSGAKQCTAADLGWLAADNDQQSH